MSNQAIVSLLAVFTDTEIYPRSVELMEVDYEKFFRSMSSAQPFPASGAHSTSHSHQFCRHPASPTRKHPLHSAEWILIEICHCARIPTFSMYKQDEPYWSAQRSRPTSVLAPTLTLKLANVGKLNGKKQLKFPSWQRPAKKQSGRERVSAIVMNGGNLGLAFTSSCAP